MNDLHAFIKSLPKAELHLHIEGSLEPEMMFELAQRNDVILPYGSVDEIRNAYNFNNLQEFFKLSDESVDDWEYTVSWIDCLATGDQLGRGIFTRGKHCETKKKHKFKSSKLSVPFDAPGFLLNKYTVSAFNNLYFKKPIKQHSIVDYDPFF